MKKKTEKKIKKLENKAEKKNKRHFFKKKKSKTDRFAPRYHFSMHPQSSYDEVIITSKNAGNKTKEQELIERAKDPDCNIWVLSTGDHPNEYGDDVKMCPLDESWEILLQKIRNILE